MKHLLCHPVLEKRMAEIGNFELPVLPEVYSALQKAVQDERNGSKEIAAIIEKDPTLVVRLLKTVNSAAYGGRVIRDVSQAISMIGLTEVTNLVLATTVAKQMPPARQGDRTLDLHKFWEHSVGVAVAARVIARHSPAVTKEMREECFIAGLIHDLGKLIHYQYFFEDFSIALNLCRKEALTITMAEQKVFGFTHGDSGAFLADEWNLSRNMVKAVELHNAPDTLDEEDESFLFVSLIHLADIFARFCQMGYGGDPFIPQFHASCFANLELQMRMVPQIVQEVRDGYAEVIHTFQESWS
jgi:HD-like signal output (HDOD) protein